MPKPEDYEDVEYEALSEESSEAEPLQRRKSSSKKWHLASFSMGGVATALLMTVIFITVRSFYRPLSPDELDERDWNNCGKTSEEAIERGCVWNHSSMHGYHPSATITT